VSGVEGGLGFGGARGMMGHGLAQGVGVGLVHRVWNDAVPEAGAPMVVRFSF
jgi:hypothetical protein